MACFILERAAPVTNAAQPLWRRLMKCQPTVDTHIDMIRDLRTILEGWDYQPGKISVRKIIGRDGREKIQTRIDLGVLQLECQGRPDGHRPQGWDSMLECQEQRLREHTDVYGDDEDFILSPEDCRELRHEAYLYYQRYLSLFVLEEFEGGRAGHRAELAPDRPVRALCGHAGGSGCTAAGSARTS